MYSELSMGKQKLLVLFAIFLVGCFINNVNARGGAFVIEPMQVVTEGVELKAADKVSGNLSVSNGFIDFYITSPSGDVLIGDNKTVFDSFKFTAKENGNYTFHFINSLSEKTVTVILSYGITFTVSCEIGMNFGLSTGVARVVAPPLPLDSPDPSLDDPYAKYLNFLRAHEILKTVRNLWKYMPLQNGVLILSCTVLAIASMEFAKHIYSKCFLVKGRLNVR
jgi:hypothetical protein